jgi:FlaA1/EpsC-like NDP-sugar epimerase
LHGVPIFGPISRLAELAADARVSEVIITMPSAGPKKLKEVIDLAKSNGLQTSIVPSFTQLAAGEVKVDRFRPVELEDLLGRKPVHLDSAGIDDLVRDRVVMVTGAGGSIGSELCRQILARGPRSLLLVEQSEVQLFQIEQELIELGHGAIARALVADVLDVPRMHEIFAAHRPHTVFHAAAHKHVVMMEHQPVEAVKNNFLGTARMAAHAREFGVRTFVLVSTDKAINPTSVMGATKRLAEHAILAEQKRPGNRTAFLAVRFGNVLGSSGSVIPIFKRQIAAGGPVTVTHPEVTRYFMTIPEAVGLVLQAATMGRGGEVFVLDMGTPLRIVDVARQLIELSGFRPDTDIEIKFIGLRAGEKLFEELRHTREDLAATDHARVLQLVGEPPVPGAVEACLGELLGSLYAIESDDLKRLIQKWVPEYTPCFEQGIQAPETSTITPPVTIAATTVTATIVNDIEKLPDDEEAARSGGRPAHSGAS